jgi:dinuclear metal center YbgI/SA1388 family protein
VPRLSDVIAALDSWYDPSWAEPWDAVGLVCGDPDAPVRRVLFAVDPVPAVAAEALEVDAQLLVTHHPLFLRGVHGVAATTYKGRLVHDLIRGGVALHAIHTNADVANPGVSDALAAALGAVRLRPLQRRPELPPGLGLGRVGELAEPCRLAELVDRAASALPGTAAGLRVAGDPAAVVRRVAVCGGAGDGLLAAAAAAGADAYLTADLRHHPVSEQVESAALAVVEAAHWATEWPWLREAADRLTGALGLPAVVSTRVTDPWTAHRPAGGDTVTW